MKLPNIRFPKLDSKGQGSMMSFMTLILGLILLSALLPIGSSIIGAMTADPTQMNNYANADLIRLMLSMTGIFMIILFFMGVFSDFTQRQTYIQ